MGEGNGESPSFEFLQDELNFANNPMTGTRTVLVATTTGLNWHEGIFQVRP